MTKVSFTDLMNKSKELRKALDVRFDNGNSKTLSRSRYIECRQAINNMEKLSHISEGYRLDYYTWLCGGSGTLDIRALLEVLNYDYWGSLSDMNVVNAIDSLVLDIR